MPGSQFSKRKGWNGKIKILKKDGSIYKGLLSKIIRLLEYKKVEYNLDPSLIPDKKVSDDFGHTLAKKYQLPFELHDYQNTAIVKALNNERGFYLCPTSSGKTAVAYILSRYWTENNKKVLMIVPTLNLLHQAYSDFEKYGYKNLEDDVHKIYANQSLNTEKGICLSTWQSLKNQDPEWFEQFDCIIGDEAHLFGAKSLIYIMTSSINAQYRIGMTGTLQDENDPKFEKNRMTVEGLFGPIRRMITSKELIERNITEKPLIHALVLPYSKEEKQAVSKMEYQDEIKFIIDSEKRNKFILNLVDNMEETTLILFNRVDTHGKILYNLINKELGHKRKVFYVSGEVKGEEREKIRQEIENTPGCIAVCSMVFSTGVSINSLRNLIMSWPSKAKISVLQSIGRMLRKMAKEQSIVNIYDLVDDLKYEGKDNYALNHFKERYKIYITEYFDVKLYEMEEEDYK